MRKYNIESFYNYLEQNYYNYSKSKFDVKTYPFPECVYAFEDLWFYTVGDVLYTLRIMGFQLGFDGNYLFFISTNELICPEVKIGDRIINIYLEKDNEDIIIEFINTAGLSQTVKVKKIEFTTKHYLTEYKLVTSDTMFIRISSFNDFNIKCFSDKLERCKYLFIDLSNNMGGSINEMINVLSIFSNCENCFRVKDAIGNTHSIKIKKSDLNLSNIKAISFKVSNLTASSAEMFVISLRSIYYGHIYGQRTVGKLFIQNFVKVDDHIVAVPVYRFQMPASKCGQNVKIDACSRIVPDIEGYPISIESSFMNAND